jgi:uncharacterized protein
MVVLGFILAAGMGILLGMLGGGGSILSVPILVYLMGVPKDVGPTYSLFIIGFASAIGAINYIRNGQFSIKTALLYGIPSTVTVFMMQKFVRPIIPNEIHVLGMTAFRGTLLMTLFAIMMLLSAWSMIRKKNRQSPTIPGISAEEESQIVGGGRLIWMGFAEGLFSGLIGAGGGFIIVPILALVAKLPMRKAVGTSLVIMAVKSLIGFGGALWTDMVIDWKLLLPFTGIAIVGILIGASLSKKIPAHKLKPIFGWFVLLVGTFVIVKTIIDA